MGEGTALLPGFDQGKWRGLEDEKGQSDNNSNADDADWADLRGFCFACGKVFFSTKELRIGNKIKLHSDWHFFDFAALLVSCIDLLCAFLTPCQIKK